MQDPCAAAAALPPKRCSAPCHLTPPPPVAVRAHRVWAYPAPAPSDSASSSGGSSGGAPSAAAPAVLLASNGAAAPAFERAICDGAGGWRGGGWRGGGCCTLGLPCSMLVTDASDPSEVRGRRGRGLSPPLPKAPPARTLRLAASGAPPGCQRATRQAGRRRPPPAANRRQPPASLRPPTPTRPPAAAPRPPAQDVPRAVRGASTSTGLRAFAQAVMGSPDSPAGILVFGSYKPGAFAGQL
jgi:hypothetical protein